MHWIRCAPLTAKTLIVCVAIYTSCLFQASTNNESFVDVQRSWGAIRSLEQPIAYDGIRREKASELYGPFDIWAGEWWRIPAAPFHHANLLHLVLCVGGTWYLGSVLERRWGSYLLWLFLLPAICIPVILELMLGQAMMGFSAVVCALLGAVVVAGQFDQTLAEELPEGVGEIGMFLILTGWLATLAGIASWPNFAHISGFFYGVLAAGVVYSRARYRPLVRISWVLAHLWLFPAILYACHPIWNGRYHWYRAVTAQNPHRTEKSLEKAVRCDPQLAGAWIFWSQLAEDRQNLELAWSRMIQGLSCNPSSSSLIDGCRRIWRHLNFRQRQQGEQVLAEHFGKRSSNWLDQIRATSITDPNESDSGFNDRLEVLDFKDFPLDQRQQLPKVELSPSVLDRLEAKPPAVPKDASEGEAL